MFGENQRDELVNFVQNQCVLHGDFTLASGLKSNYYIDLRRAALDGKGAHLITQLLFQLINYRHPDIQYVAGPATASIPIVIGLAMEGFARQANLRQGVIVELIAEEKIAGITPGDQAWMGGNETTSNIIELKTGEKFASEHDLWINSGGKRKRAIVRNQPPPQEPMVIVDDVFTTGGSIKQAADALGLVVGAYCVLDRSREESTKQAFLNQLGISELGRVLTLADLGL